jgi:Gluconate 2-dehydrogenase subunit 3
MRRRQFIAIFGLVPLSGTTTLWRNLVSFSQPAFNEHTAQTVMAVTDLMFPGNGLPGASELGVHNRIVAMSDLHDMMRDGVDWLDQLAKGQGATDFLTLDESTRLAAVEAASSSENEEARQFVLSLRYYGALNYYSEPAIKAAFPYTGPPQPEGFADFQDPPK